MNNQKLFEAEVDVLDFGVVVIRLHFRSHFDEVVAYMLISQLADAEWCRHYCSDGKIDIGFGGGWLDDHAVSIATRREESCALIAAKSFGVDTNQDFLSIIEYAHFEDNNQTRDKDSLANLLWLMQQFWPEQEEDNLNWALQGLSEMIGKGKSEFRLNMIAANFDDPIDGDKWRLRGEEILEFQQIRFLDAVDEIENAKERGELLQHSFFVGGKRMLAAAICSDNPCAAPAMRWRRGLSADVAVVRSGCGHYYVSVGTRKTFDLGSAIAVLRVEEQRVARHIKVTEWSKLKSDGTLSDVPEWFFFRKGSKLMNGSLTRPEVPASKLSLKKVLGCVVLALNQDLWHEGRICKKGSCSGRHCQWYAYGLDRCCARRAEYRRRTVNSSLLPHVNVGP